MTQQQHLTPELVAALDTYFPKPTPPKPIQQVNKNGTLRILKVNQQ